MPEESTGYPQEGKKDAERQEVLLTAADALDQFNGDVESDRGSDDNRLTHFNSVNASENVDAVGTEYRQHAHVDIVQGACTGGGVYMHNIASHTLQQSI